MAPRRTRACGASPPADDTDGQENLDGLAASNMSNLGLIDPIGVTVYLLLRP